MHNNKTTAIMPPTVPPVLPPEVVVLAPEGEGSEGEEPDGLGPAGEGPDGVGPAGEGPDGVGPEGPLGGGAKVGKYDGLVDGAI